MKVFRIDEEHRDIFEFIDPFGMMSREKIGNGYSYGAFIQSRKDGYDYPVGLVVCSETDDAVLIHWLCVAPQYRGKGHGEYLLRFVFEIAKNKGKKYVSAYFSEMVNRKYICFDDRHYFAEHGFEHETVLGSEWIFDIRTLKKSNEWKKLISEYGNKDAVKQPVSLSGLKESEGKKLFEKTFDASGSFSLFGTELIPEKIDLDISFVQYEEAFPDGVLLFQKAGDVIFPVFLYTKNSDTENALVFSAAEAIEKKYGKKMLINAVVSNERNRHILSRFLPEFEISNSMMTALTGIIKSQRMYDIADFFETEELIDKYYDNPDEIQFSDLLVQGEDTSFSVSVLMKKIGINIKSFDDIYSLSELDFWKRQRIILECLNIDKCGIFKRMPHELDVSQIEQDVSCCILQDDELKGILLVHMDEQNRILPVLVYCAQNDEKATRLTMMKYSLMMASDLYGEDTELILRRHDEFSGVLINKLLEKLK